MKEVGEEFWSDWVSHPTSTDPRETRLLYKVVEIVQIHEHGTFGKLIDAERVEPIEVERRLPNPT